VVGWLVGWLVGWFIACLLLVDSSCCLVGWLGERLGGWVVGCCVVGCVGGLGGWLFLCVGVGVERMVGRMCRGGDLVSMSMLHPLTHTYIHDEDIMIWARRAEGLEGLAGLAGLEGLHKRE